MVQHAPLKSEDFAAYRFLEMTQNIHHTRSIVGQYIYASTQTVCMQIDPYFLGIQ
jgi:hypothetical protein